MPGLELGQLVSGHPVVLIHLAGLFNESFQLVFDGKGELDAFLGHFEKQLFLSLAVPGSLAAQHLVEDDAEGEDVRFAGVLVGPQGLGGHVERSAHIKLIEKELGLAGGGEAEVADLPGVAVPHNVGGLQVAVKVALLGDVEVGGDDLADDFECLVFLDLAFLVEEGTQVAVGTVLGDDVVKVLGLVGVVEFHDVGVAHASMRFDFSLQHRQIGGFEFGQVDYFDCEDLILLLRLHCLIHSAAEALPDQILFPEPVRAHARVPHFAAHRQYPFLRCAGPQHGRRLQWSPQTLPRQVSS